MTLKRGMKEWREDAIKLQLSDYLVRKELPVVPKVYGHIKSNDIPWGMLGNDQCGDCVMAGACHEIMVWALATKRILPDFNVQGVVEQYMGLSGGKDEGLDPIATAKWRVTTGVTDGTGQVHKVKAFASVNNNKDLDTAAYIFGVCGCGFNLPESAMAEFGEGKPWENTNEKGTGGHYVPLVGRNSRGYRIVVTWGRLQAVSNTFWRKYFVGGIAYFSLEYMLASGISPEGINEAALDSNLAALA